MEEKETKAPGKVKPSWIKTKPEQMEKIVADLAKERKTSAQIGLILRDKHGIPKSKLLGKKVKVILDEKGTDYKSDKNEIDAKIKKLKTHIEKNKHDYTATRSLTKKLWALYKLKKLSQD